MRNEIYLRNGKTLEGKFHTVPVVSEKLQGPDHQEKESQLTWGEGPVLQCAS